MLHTEDENRAPRRSWPDEIFHRTLMDENRKIQSHAERDRDVRVEALAGRYRPRPAVGDGSEMKPIDKTIHVD